MLYFSLEVRIMVLVVMFTSTFCMLLCSSIWISPRCFHQVSTETKVQKHCHNQVLTSDTTHSHLNISILTLAVLGKDAHCLHNWVFESYTLTPACVNLNQYILFFLPNCHFFNITVSSTCYNSVKNFLSCRICSWKDPHTTIRLFV